MLQLLLLTISTSSFTVQNPHHRPPKFAKRHFKAVSASLSASDSEWLANGLGYVVGAGSLLLYTPIAAKIIRQRSADGLVLSTWWLKLTSYAASDIYAYRNGYPITQYIETLVITFEAGVILLLVGYLQKRLDGRFALITFGTGSAALWALTAAPPSGLAAAQAASTLLNTGALLPQLALNARKRSAGDYSPITASLACTGCLIRIFTTNELAGGDPLLLAGFVAGFALNAALLAQVIYFGVVADGKSISGVMTSDFTSK